MRKLKLRGAARYTVLSVSKDPVQRNQTIDVDDATAEGLLKQQIKDRANTSWPVWEDVTPEGGAEVKKTAVKKTRARRKKATAPAEEATA